MKDLLIKKLEHAKSELHEITISSDDRLSVCAIEICSIKLNEVLEQLANCTVLDNRLAVAKACDVSVTVCSGSDFTKSMADHLISIADDEWIRSEFDSVLTGRGLNSPVDKLRNSDTGCYADLRIEKSYQSFKLGVTTTFNKLKESK